MEEENLNMQILKQKIEKGITQMTNKEGNTQAVLFIGNTGVGKSSLMAYLANEDLKIEQIGLKPCLTSLAEGKVKIGHEKYSETTLPNEMTINGRIFFDCPGFNDNTEKQSQIANSFYLQRLMKLYEKVKLILVIDYSYLTESRSHCLPQLTSSLEQAFGSLSNIKNHCLLIINKCSKQWSFEDVSQELQKIINEKNLLKFSEESKAFYQHLLESNQIQIFYSPCRKEIGTIFNKSERNKILQKINQLQFCSHLKINNIISNPVKLAIRQFIDERYAKCSAKLTSCFESIDNKINECSKFWTGGELDFFLQKMKEFGERIAQNFMNEEGCKEIFSMIRNQFFQNTNQHDQLVELEETLNAIFFFKNIYGESSILQENLKNQLREKIFQTVLFLGKIKRKKSEEKKKMKRKEGRRSQDTNLKNKKQDPRYSLSGKMKFSLPLQQVSESMEFQSSDKSENMNEHQTMETWNSPTLEDKTSLIHTLTDNWNKEQKIDKIRKLQLLVLESQKQQNKILEEQLEWEVNDNSRVLEEKRKSEQIQKQDLKWLQEEIRKNQEKLGKQNSISKKDERKAEKRRNDLLRYEKNLFEMVLKMRQLSESAVSFKNALKHLVI